MKKDDKKVIHKSFSNNNIGDNFSHNSINNDNESNKKPLIEKLIIGIIITVVGGLILWCITSRYKII